MWVAVKSISYEHIVSMMAQIKWDIKEILSMHNTYVDILLRELHMFNARYEEITKQHFTDITLPKQVYNLLWEQILRLSNRAFIEGFSQTKKCSNEGRALMQLDYQQFITKVETITTLRPIPERELVDEYIKAFYLTEPALIEWIKSRKEYNHRQIVALINCITYDNRKMRSRLTSMF